MNKLKSFLIVLIIMVATNITIQAQVETEKNYDFEVGVEVIPGDLPVNSNDTIWNMQVTIKSIDIDQITKVTIKGSEANSESVLINMQIVIPNTSLPDGVTLKKENGILEIFIAGSRLKLSDFKIKIKAEGSEEYNVYQIKKIF